MVYTYMVKSIVQVKQITSKLHGDRAYIALFLFGIINILQGGNYENHKF